MQILTRSANGQLIANQPYFASLKSASLLGADYVALPARSSAKKLVYEGFRRHSLRDVTLSHRVILAANLQGGTIQPGGQSITMPAPIVIDGMPVEAGDEIEISKAIATAIGCAAGRWLASDQFTISLTNPLRYTATSADNFGGKPWRFRTLADGSIAGLALASVANLAVSDAASTTNVSGMLKAFDNNYSTYTDLLSLNTGQQFTATFDSITAIRVELMASSSRLPGDVSFPKATFSVRSGSHGPIFSWFRHSATDVAFRWGPPTWSRGSPEWYYSDAFDPGRAMSGLQVIDSGGSRALLYHFGILVDAPCRIAIGGVYPELGAVIEIPPPIANAMKPPIAPGDYVVVLNDGTAPWKITQV